jgi:dienelactone hydrolase
MSRLRFLLGAGCALLLATGARAESAAADVAPLEAPLVTPEPTTIESHVLIWLYDRLKPVAASAFRVEFPGADGETRVAHWQLPPGTGPHPTVVVFPIRAGNHVVSEALAKALVNRGYAAIWIEKRRSLFGDDDHRAPGDFAAFAADLSDFVLDARRLIGWLATRPEVDPERIATAGVSLGGILAATTLAQEPRAHAGFFVMAGGGLPEILRDSQDGDVVEFRAKGIAAKAFVDPGDLARRARAYTDPMDPLTWAHRIEPEQVLLISARYDQVIAPERTLALWQALGRPRWLTVPTGHYQLVPYFWWAVGRGADHLDHVFGRAGAPAPAAQAAAR